MTLIAPVQPPRSSRLTRARALLAPALLAAVLAGCTPASSPAPPAPASGNVSPPPATAVTPPAPTIPDQAAAQSSDKPTAIETAFIKNNAFSPATMIVQVGTVVLWNNQDSTQHTVTGPGWELGPFGNGESWAHTFNKVGQEEIHCRLHPEMTMKVTVMAKQP